MYFLAILFPPLAVLFCKKPMTALLNLVLWLCFIVPGIIHGLLVVKEYKTDERLNKYMKSVNK